jgi:peptide/nickel transport system permease protein
LAPGGPLASADPRVRAADRERVERVLGLDRPLAAQYGRWLAAVARGDLGRSFSTGQPVGAMIVARLPATVELMAVALSLSLTLGIGLGIAGALHPGSWWDRGLAAASLAGVSIPIYWLGVLAILVFSAAWGWLPAGGRASLGVEFSWLDHVRHLILPVAVLTAAEVPLWSRHVRANLIERLRDESVRAARARGLPERRILMRHGLPGALVPLVGLLGLQVPVLFTGAVITETVFAWPGLGRLFHDGVVRFDYPRVLGILAVAAVLTIAGNLAADLLGARLDPRLRQRRTT